MNNYLVDNIYQFTQPINSIINLIHKQMLKRQEMEISNYHSVAIFTIIISLTDTC